jgi:hypothetical protein
MLENSTLRTWLASVAVSFALGFGVAWTMKPQEPAIAATVALPPTDAPAVLNPFVATAPAAPAAHTSAPPKTASVEALWARALAREPGYDAEDSLRKLAQSNPVAVRFLMQRYDGATPQARELLKSVLSTVQTPDVIAFSTRLANSSNAAERQYGFEMLQFLAPDAPEVRTLVKRTLSTEQSPEVLVQALATLKSGVAEPEESDWMVAQLKSLSQHADATVRTQSIMQLGQWDKKGESADRLSQALSDRVPEVRSAAIFAIANTGVRSDSVKLALMGLISNPQESRDVRGSALQALERFSLNKDEYASFTQARTLLRGL